jgi:Rod binding domain-containing protein
MSQFPSISPFSGLGVPGSGLGPAPNPTSGPRSPSIERQDDFSAVIARARPTGAAGQSPEQRARAAAEQFVAIALVQPLLSQLRQSNEAAPPFAPSQGERQFRSLMDAQLAHQMVHAARFPLVDRLARDLLKNTGPAHIPAAQPPAASPEQARPDAIHA